MQSTRARVFTGCLPILAARSAIACLLFISTLAWAQDSPGRFEVGGNLTAIRLGGGQFGPGVEGDFNLGRHFAVDGAYSWLPTVPNHVMTGLFGVKAGTRTQRFGFFGKVRPGFISFGNSLREETIVFGPGLLLAPEVRFGRLTERALDIGGVTEFYPTRHWALRWDAGDTILFHEQGPKITLILPPGSPISLITPFPARTTNQFQFSTGVHYRF